MFEAGEPDLSWAAFLSAPVLMTAGSSPSPPWKPALPAVKPTWLLMWENTSAMAEVVATPFASWSTLISSEYL